MKKFFNKDGIMIPETIITKQASPEELKSACVLLMNDKVLWKKESEFHDISVCENPVGRFLKYGISYQAGIVNTEFYKGNIPYLNYFLIPYVLRPEAKNILVIGFGSGLLVNQYEKLFDNLESIDIVDIEENILYLAKEFFGFKESEKFNFNLQDALVYLRNNSKKYDIIAVDVAGNEGLDKRFFEKEFYGLIKKSLKDDGIYIFNSCANTDLSLKDTFYGFTVDVFNHYFNNFAVFPGKKSDIVYYKSFFNTDKPLLDIINCIFVGCEKKLTAEDFVLKPEIAEKIKEICPDFEDYLSDLYKIYKARK